MATSKKILLIVGAIALVVVVALICLFTSKEDEKTIYTVTFNSNGGNVISEQSVEEGMTATKPQDPTKEGYIFIEWLLDGRSYDFSSPVNKNIILRASWLEENPEKELVTIKFNTDGGTTIANAVIEKGGKPEKPSDPTKDGYTFVEWQLSGSKYDFDKEVTEDLELAAKWEKNKTENKSSTNEPTTNKPSNNNFGNNNSGNNNYGSSTTPTTPTTNKPSNNNSGNNNSGNNNSGSSTTPTTPTVKKYTVSFDTKGGSSVASQTVEEGKKASKPSDPTRTGYTFGGWTLNGSNYDFNSAVKGNITLVAKWTENPKAKYTVTFNSNGGSSVANQTVEEGKKASKPSDPTRTGYTFGGWTLNGSNYDFNSAVKGNIKLVAKWNAKSYTVKISAVDDYSPARILSVYENGSKITVKEIRYSDGTYLCSGANPNVNKNAIAGETSLIVVLSDGTRMTASIN